MTASEILEKKVHLQGVKLQEHNYDSRFTFLEIKGQNDVPFKMFYYIVDSEDDNVYYGSYQIPDVVNVERIRRGLETSI